MAGEAFILLKPYTENDIVIYGRNSCDCDGQELIYIRGNDDLTKVKCQSIEVDGSCSFSTILSKPAGFWGAESGSNEKGVCIGLTFTENEPAEGFLLGTDYTRLGLERSASAEEAVDIITALAKEHGPPGETRESPKYCFIICDNTEAWLLNIVGSIWGAERITEGFRSIPIGLSVTTKVDKSTNDLEQLAQTLALWAGNGEFNFSDIFSSSTSNKLVWPDVEPNEGTCNVTDMFKVLRKQSMVKEAYSSHVSTISSDGISCHWFTATKNPVESVFKPFVFTNNVRMSSSLTTISDGEKMTTLQKLHANRNWDIVGDLLKSLESSCVEEVQGFLAENSDTNHELDELLKDCVEAEVKFYR